MTATAFPALNQVYPSLDHFKLAAYEAAVEQGVELILDITRTHKVEVRCRVRSESTVFEIGSGEQCDFALCVSNSGEDGARLEGDEARVVTAVLEHSCDDEVRAAREASGKVWMEGKLAHLRRTMEAAAARTFEAELEKEEGAGKGPRQSLLIAHARLAKSPSKRSRDGDSCGGDDQSYVEEEEEEEEELYPRAARLADEIKDLISRDQVSFPSSHDVFPTASSLLPRFHACALHRDFRLYRSTSLRNTSSFRLKCWKGHERFNGKPGGDCRVFVLAAKQADGTWRVSDSYLVHSHACSPGDADGPSSPTWRKKGKKRRARRSRPCPAKASTSHAAEPKQVSLLQHPAPGGAPRPAPSPYNQSLATPSPDFLSSFLVALSPLLPLANALFLASVLAAAGLGSIDDLVSLVLLDPSIIRLFLHDLSARGVGVAECEWLESLLDEAQAELGR
ncbi:hypothetical protein JCM10207_003398 [Rhodosporidiobolus poonsookiae]